MAIITMPAITLWQPWASWIAEGYKTIETRTHDRFRNLKGKRIAIHAGRRWHEEALDIARTWMPPDWGTRVMDWIDLCGCVICTADVLDFRNLGPADSASAMCDTSTGLYGLVLGNIQPFEVGVLAKGRQGIWTWRYSA